MQSPGFRGGGPEHVDGSNSGGEARFEVRGGVGDLEGAATVNRNAANGVEEGVRRIWEEVLGREGIRPEDDLFELGGHSLLITRIISRIRRVFGVEVPIYAFFETPTLGEIADEVKRLNEERKMQNEECGMQK
jgi:acyl carrier protein